MLAVYLRNMTFTEPSLGCWSSGHRNLSKYQVSSSTVFFFVSYMHIQAPFIMYCSRLFVVVLQEINCLQTCLCSSGHRASSLYQVSCLSVLWLVRYVSRTGKRRRRRRRRILKLTISNLTPFLGIYFLTRGTF